MDDGANLEDAGNAIHALLNHYHDEVVPAFGRLDAPEKQVVQVALLVRSPPLVEAVLHLAEAGFGRETMMLNRPLFELLLDADWAGSNPKLADERLLAHARYIQHLRRETAARHPDLGIPSGEGELSKDEIRDSSKRFGRFGTGSWTGLNMKRRVEAFEGNLDDGEKSQLRFIFDVMHDLNNNEIHPSSWSLGRALRRIPTGDGDFKIQYRVGPEPELAVSALGCTWWAFVHLLRLMHEMNETATDLLWEAANAGIELLGLASSPESGRS